MATPNPLVSKKPEDMSPLVGHSITLTAYGLPLVVVMALGFAIGNGWTAMGFAVIWAAFSFVASIRFVRKRTFLVVERFGYFWDVKFTGLRIIIPMIDNVVRRDDFLQKSVDLYKGDVKIDFNDASAPIRASAWYQIGDPKKIDAGDFASVRDDVLTYVYRVREAEVESRIAEIFQGTLRPLLESSTLVDVQKNGEKMAAQATDEATESLSEVGVYPFPAKGIIIADIALPDNVIALREQELQGEVEAKAAVSRARGYWEPLAQIKANLEKQGMRISDQEARDFFLTLRGFETIDKTGSNISFVSSDLGGVLKTIGVGSVGGDKKIVTGATVASAREKGG